MTTAPGAQSLDSRVLFLVVKIWYSILGACKGRVEPFTASTWPMLRCTNVSSANTNCARLSQLIQGHVVAIISSAIHFRSSRLPQIRISTRSLYSEEERASVARQFGVASCQHHRKQSQSLPDRRNGIIRNILPGRGLLIYELHGLLSQLATTQDQQPELQDTAITGRGTLP
jgi:hypothetical protein